jgi:hypothetical protein
MKLSYQRFLQSDLGDKSKIFYVWGNQERLKADVVEELKIRLDCRYGFLYKHVFFSKGNVDESLANRENSYVLVLCSPEFEKISSDFITGWERRFGLVVLVDLGKADRLDKDLSSKVCSIGCSSGVARKKNLIKFLMQSKQMQMGVTEMALLEKKSPSEIIYFFRTWIPMGVVSKKDLFEFFESFDEAIHALVLKFIEKGKDRQTVKRLSSERVDWKSFLSLLTYHLNGILLLKTLSRTTGYLDAQKFDYSVYHIGEYMRLGRNLDLRDLVRRMSLLANIRLSEVSNLVGISLLLSGW